MLLPDRLQGEALVLRGAATGLGRDGAAGREEVAVREVLRAVLPVTQPGSGGAADGAGKILPARTAADHQGEQPTPSGQSEVKIGKSNKNLTFN